MTDTTLRECPFCGSEDVSLRKGVVAFYDYEVWCEGCGICGPNFGAMDGSEENEDRNRAAAIEHWNTRNDSHGRDLRKQMEAAGMISVDDILKPNEMTKWLVHSGMTDLQFFEQWVERNARESIKMQIAHQTGSYKLEDDLFNFVLGKAGAYKDVLENFRAAKEGELND